MRLRLNIFTGARRKSLSTLLMICFGLTITALCVSDAQTLSGNSLTINVTTAVPGSEPTPVVNTSLQITYKTPPGGGNPIYKITVFTVCPNQKFYLSVVAGSIPNGGGTAASAVTLQNGMLATDFITGIKKNQGPFTVTLRYTSAPQFSDGTGTDNHTVKYTLTQ